MEYQTIKENGKVKFVVLPVKSFQTILNLIEGESDMRDIREAKSEPLYDQNETEDYIFWILSNGSALKEDGPRKNLPIELV